MSTTDGFRYVEEMLGTELEEVSGVDEPATDRPFLLFKSASGNGMQGVPRGTPALAAARAAVEHVRALSKAVPEGADRATFESCLDHVMEQIDSGQVQPREGEDPKSTAYAICTAQGAGQGGGTRRAPAAKEGTMPEMPAVGDPVSPDGLAPPPLVPDDGTAEVLEIPAAPSSWTFSDCIRDAQAKGMDENSAVASCQILRSDFGDPENPDTILVPQGSSTEGMLASAAIHGGIAVPGGLAGKQDPSLKFTGGNRWLNLWRRFIGKERPTPPATPAAEIEALRKEMADMQAKSTGDLKEILAENRRILNLIAQMGGIVVDDEEEQAGAVVAPGAAPGPSMAAPAAALVEPKSAPAAKDAHDERFDRIEAAIAAILARLGGESEPEAVVPAAAPPDLTQPEPIKTADPNRFRRSRDPIRPAAGTKAAGSKRASSILGGALVSAEDRKALGWKHGV